MKATLTSIALLLVLSVTLARTATGQTFKPAPPADGADAIPAAPAAPAGPATDPTAGPAPPAAPPATPGAPAAATGTAPVPAWGAAPGPGAPPVAGYPPAPPPPAGGYPPGYAPPPGYQGPPGSPRPAYPPVYPPPPAYGQSPYGAPPGWPYPYGVYPYRPPPKPPGAETHDGGFLRLQIGLHGSTLTGKTGGDHVDYSGSGASLGIAAGYALAPNFILFGEAMIAGNANADVKVNGTGSVTTNNNLDTNLAGIGPGASLYFGPNFFVSTAILFASMTIDRSGGGGGTLVSSKTGVALDAVVGKEWWVSDNWGLGISGQMLLGSAKGKDPDVTLGLVPDNWSFVGFSLLFSATYN